jgi:hypothetical protein
MVVPRAELRDRLATVLRLLMAGRAEPEPALPTPANDPDQRSLRARKDE